MAEQRKLFTFRKYADGSDEPVVEFKCESRQGCECLAEIYLFSKQKPKTGPDYTAKLALEAFLSAEEAGHPQVELPEGKALRSISVIDVLELLNQVKIDVKFEGGNEGPDDEAVENPTDTEEESS